MIDFLSLSSSPERELEKLFVAKNETLFINISSETREDLEKKKTCKSENRSNKLS